MAKKGIGAKPSPKTDNRAKDVPSPRTKSSGHGKKTADKWNQ